MARKCQLTGVGPLTGNVVSHANNKTKTRSFPNLQTKRYFLKSKNGWVTLRLSTRALRTLDKYAGDVEQAARHFKELQKWI